MSKITAPRRVVIEHCRKQERSRNKMTAYGFARQLGYICKDLADNDGTLSPDQAWFIAEGIWALVTRDIDPEMAPAFSCLALPALFDDMSDYVRVQALAFRIARLRAIGLYENESPDAMCANTLSMGIRIATDALLASSPEIFQEG